MTNSYGLFATILLYFCSLLTHPVQSEEIVIKIPEARSVYDISHDYHVELLKLALQYTDSTYRIENTKLPLTQGRAQLELFKGELIDLYWLGSEKELDNRLRAVPIPTTRGLIGFRKFFIRPEMAPDFAKLKTLSDLKKFIACQGQHWPDTKILQAAKLPVTSSSTYETLFNMLAAGRCDYFPRGIHDYLTELEFRKNKRHQFAQQDSLQLYYPFAVYFYTNQQHSELAAQLTDSMTKLAKNGELLAFMKSHPLTQQVFVSAKSKSQRIIELDNPLMTPNPRVSDPDFWFQPEHFLQDSQQNETK